MRQSYGRKDYAGPWLLPHTLVIGQVSLRQAADRLLRDMFGAEQQLCRVTGNAPHAAVAYRLPRPVCHAQQLPAKCAVSCADSDSQSISLRCST